MQRKLPDSFDENWKSAEVLAIVPLGPETARVVSGAALSTVHCQVDSPERLPLQSSARTWNVYVPDDGFSCRPEVQVCQSWMPATRHSKRRNVESDAALKVNVAAPLTTWFGPVSEAMAGFVSSTNRARSCRSACVANWHATPL